MRKRSLTMIAAASASAAFQEAVPSAKPSRMANKPSRMAKVAHPVGMRDSHVRTDLRAGDIASWGWERLCAVAASLEQGVHVVLVPPGMKAVVAFEPA